MKLGTACKCGGCGCGCCEGIQKSTPVSTENRPGLSRLSYRVGTHGSFLQSMKAALSSHVLAGDPGNPTTGTRPLAALRTRDSADPAIALLDAWATVGDVLTFYQERIANEGYLRTATETRSLYEMARLVGYQPRPGVAASAYLAYTLDSNVTDEIVIPAGSRSTTVPGQDELPQSFETSEDLRARAAWNKLGLRQTEPQQWDDQQLTPTIYLAGTQTRLKPGDPLLVDPGGDPDAPPRAYRVLSVDVDVAADRTAVRIEPWLAAATLGRLGHRLQSLHASAPEGKVSAEVLRELDRLNTDAADPGRFSATLPEVRELVHRRQAEVHGLRAPRLHPWLDAVAVELETMGDRFSASGAQQDRGAPLESRLRSLAKPASKPRNNALQLPRSLASNFDRIADTGLKVLGAVEPGVKDTLAPALAGYEAASPPQPIRVWALRLQAGVFGRNFPRRTRTVLRPDPSNDGQQISETVDVGEWPIVVDAVSHEGGAFELVTKEEESTLYLDAAHDGIAPDSWVLVDSTAVPTYSDEKLTMVVPAQPSLVARIRAVSPKVARADYGGNADSTVLSLATVDGEDAQWIRFTVTSEEQYKERANQAVFDRDHQVIRRNVVYAKSEPLALAEQPITRPLCSRDDEYSGNAQPVSPRAGAPADDTVPIELNGLYADLEPGRFVIVTGERSDIGATTGVLASEPAMITAVVHDVRAAGAERGPWTHAVDQALLAPASASGQPAKLPQKLPGDHIHTFIWLDKPLSYCYRADTVAILGNVVKATHGETRVETLGHGDGAKALQSFELKQSPLTHLAAATPSGAQSTLSIYVNNVRWHETPGFVDQASTDRIFITQMDDEGKTRVTFGNGHEGARLPTGLENVKAIYRNGIGRPGNVLAGQIRQLATKPLGVKEVVNPLRASGGADREGLAQVRRNAPLAVKSLDRLVSTRDYADFARTFAGIAKAQAQELSDGRHSVVHLTIAGLDDIPIEPDSDLLLNLRRALRDFGDPFQPLVVVPRELRLMIVSARLRIDPDHLWEPVVTDVRNALLDAFGFDQRELAQGVASSEVLSVIQHVRGVLYADLEAFGAIDTLVHDEVPPRPLTPDETSDAVADVVAQGVKPAVQSWPARRGLSGSGLLPAQLTLLSPQLPETLVLNQIT
jgi:hypothetical protein